MVSKFPSNILFHQQMFSLLDTLSADKACVRDKVVRSQALMKILGTYTRKMSDK